MSHFGVSHSPFNVTEVYNFYGYYVVDTTRISIVQLACKDATHIGVSELAVFVRIISLLESVCLQCVLQN